MKTVLSIAGFDPSSGAGITADLMVFAAHGLFGTSCITALTVQSTQGVRATYPVSDQIVGETLDWLDEDLRPAGIKIGVIATSQNVFRICRYIDKLNASHSHPTETSTIPIVLDPVLRSSSGRELLEPSALVAMRGHLLPLVDWVTPNLDELAVLLDEPAVDRAGMPNACRALQARAVASGRRRHPLGIIATGGHLDRPDDFLLLPDGEGIWLPGERVETRFSHGTGCAFSSSFLSRLVLGDPPEAAANVAKAYVAGALRAAQSIGIGNSPINHLWKIDNAKH